MSWWLCAKSGRILNDEDDKIILRAEAEVRLHAHPEGSYAIDTATGDRIERDPRFPIVPRADD